MYEVYELKKISRFKKDKETYLFTTIISLSQMIYTDITNPRDSQKSPLIQAYA